MILTKEQLHDALVERHGADIQAKLDKACVGIAGLGGLGSNLAIFLARLGVGHLILVDFDVVDITNLNRQHYTKKDLGIPKTLALVEQLEAINPYLTYETYTERVVPSNVERLFSGCDVVVEAFDKPDQKAMLLENLLTRLPEKPVVSGSGMAGYGSANLIKTEKRFGHVYLCGDGTSDVADDLIVNIDCFSLKDLLCVLRTEAAAFILRSPLFFRLIGTAVCTLDSLDRNFAAAERARFGGRRSGCFGLLAEAGQLVDRLEQTEQHERHNEEVDDRGNERTVAQLDRAEHKYKAAQIGAAEQTDDRIDKVFGQQGDNAGESAADDNTDRHVHHVAAQREGFELFDKLFHFYVPLSYLYYQFTRFP